MTIQARAKETYPNVDIYNVGKVTINFESLTLERRNAYTKGINEQIALDAKWISENVGSDVAVDFLKAMED